MHFAIYVFLLNNYQNRSALLKSIQYLYFMNHRYKIYINNHNSITNKASQSIYKISFIINNVIYSL